MIEKHWHLLQVNSKFKKGSQFFETTTGIQSGLDAFKKWRLSYQLLNLSGDNLEIIRRVKIFLKDHLPGFIIEK